MKRSLSTLLVLAVVLAVLGPPVAPVAAVPTAHPLAALGMVHNAGGTWTNKLPVPSARGYHAIAHGHRASPMPWHYTEMGRPVADAGNRDWDELTAEYSARLMEGLAVLGTRRSGRSQPRQRPKGPALDGLPEESPFE